MITAEIKYNKWIKYLKCSTHNKTNGKVYWVLCQNKEVYWYIDDNYGTNRDSLDMFIECNEDWSDIKKDKEDKIDKLLDIRQFTLTQDWINAVIIRKINIIIDFINNQ